MWAYCFTTENASRFWNYSIGKYLSKEHILRALALEGVVVETAYYNVYQIIQDIGSVYVCLYMV